MPELPEVENIKLGLEPKVLNKKIIEVNISDVIKKSHEIGKKSLIKDDLNYFESNVLNKNIKNIKRRGKYIYFELDKGYLVTHFGMTGAYFVVKKLEEIENKNYFKHKHIIFTLDTKEYLVYSDIRRFGELRYIEDVSSFKPFNNLAPEPFEKNSRNYFLEKLSNKKYINQAIKPVLLDGNVFCGCGNIYACEVLYRESIHPETLVSELSVDRLKKLYKKLVDILDFSIQQGGSTISDFVHSDGEEGNMQNYLQIYGKKVCPKGHKTENITQKTRSTHFCPVCQKR